MNNKIIKPEWVPSGYRDEHKTLNALPKPATTTGNQMLVRRSVNTRSCYLLHWRELRDSL